MKIKIILVTMLMLVVKAGMAQTNPTSTNSQNTAAVADNSGIFATGYHNDFQYSTPGINLINTYVWADGSDGQLDYQWMQPPITQEIQANWTTNSWPQTVPLGPFEWLFNGIPFSVGNGYLIGVSDYSHDGISISGSTFHQDEEAEFKLATGGPPGSKTNRLWMVSANVNTEMFTPQWDTAWESPISSVAVNPVPYDQVSVGVFGKLDDLGNAFKMLPDNDPDDVTVRVNGHDHYGPTAPAASVVDLLSLTVVSNAPYSMIDSNCVAVKTTTNDWVYVLAKLSTDDTNAAQFIQWSGGEAVPDEPFQHRVTKMASAKTTVTATLGPTTQSLDVWILWSTINYQFSGTNPSPLLFQNNGGFPDEILGVQQYLGAYWGKMCAIATITPAGAHEVVSNGWSFVQAKITRYYANGSIAPGSTYPSWASDSTPTTSTLDSKDNLYLIDAPNLPALNGSTSNESYQNFRNFIFWGGSLCCDTNYFWHWAARQQTSVDLTNLGAGTISIPTNSYYP